MKEKRNPESKLNITLKNTNKKRDIIIDDAEEEKEGGSLLKKNEYAFIFLGAALLSIVIVFIFFRPSGKQDAAVTLPPEADLVQVFEKRITHIETILAEKLGSDAGFGDRDTEGTPEERAAAVEAYKQRVERVETAFTVKFDSLAERLDRLEKQIALVSQKAAAPIVQEKPPVKTVSPVKTAAVTKTKPAAGKEPMLHTVEKGETLYSISRKYGTTVEQLRKLNNLSEKADIYPGNNILVR